MKRVKKFLVISIILLFALSLTGCSSSNKNELLGAWEWTTRVDLDVTEFSFIEEMWVDGTITYEFSKDNTFTYVRVSIMSNDVSGAGDPEISTKSGTFKLNDNYLTLTFTDGTVEEYLYSITDSPTTLVLTTTSGSLSGNYTKIS